MPRRPPAAAAQETRTARSDRPHENKAKDAEEVERRAGIRRLTPANGTRPSRRLDACTRRPAEASGRRRSDRAERRPVRALRCGRSLHQEKSGPLATAWLRRTAEVARRSPSEKAAMCRQCLLVYGSVRSGRSRLAQSRAERDDREEGEEIRDGDRATHYPGQGLATGDQALLTDPAAGRSGIRG